MKPRHAAALALVVWYLMQPPLPHLNTHAVHKDTAAALRGWKMVRSFPTQKECEAHRANPWERSIASDDPRLKERSRCAGASVANRAPKPHRCVRRLEATLTNL
jgi:hypothetical protein